MVDADSRIILNQTELKAVLLISPVHCVLWITVFVNFMNDYIITLFTAPNYVVFSKQFLSHKHVTVADEYFTMGVFETCLIL